MRLVVAEINGSVQIIHPYSGAVHNYMKDNKISSEDEGLKQFAPILISQMNGLNGPYPGHFLLRTQEELPKIGSPRVWQVNDDATITINMEKAKKEVLDRLREERKDMFSTLDLEYMRADELNDKEAKTKVVIKKQRLRQLPENPLLLMADTPESLYGLTLESLIE